VYDDALADNLPGPVDYQQLDAVPAVIRRSRASTVEALPILTYHSVPDIA
jgi:hypothetical protein